VKTLVHYAAVALLLLVLLLPLRAQSGSAGQPAGAPNPEPQPQQPTVHAKVSAAGRPMLGSEDAPITIVEFTDYQCPYCQQFHLTTFSVLKKDYIDTGKLRFYVKDLPLDFHPNAMNAAQASRCANEQGQFWTLRDIMVRNAQRLEMPNILFWAKDLRMDSGALLSCIQSGKYKHDVQSDVTEAIRIGASGTPAFVVGKSTPHGVDGELVVGVLPYSVFEQKLRDLERQQ